MRYYLRKDIIGKVPIIDIDEERFYSLKNAFKILTEAFAIEEKYELLISNYLELEKVSINISVIEMVRTAIEYLDFFDVSLELNTRLVNLLTSVRLYTDQLARHVAKCIPNIEDSKDVIKGYFVNEFENNADFRFMEELRNYVQHYGIPVHSATLGSKWTELDDGLLEYSISFKAKKKNFITDGKFKKRILDEMPDEVNLRSATRSYIESISSVHQQARDLIQDSVNDERKNLEDTIAEYEEEYKKDSLGLMAYAFEENEKIDEVPILLKWDDIRIRLQKRNRKLVNLKRRYATGQIVEK